MLPLVAAGLIVTILVLASIADIVTPTDVAGEVLELNVKSGDTVEHNAVLIKVG